MRWRLDRSPPTPSGAQCVSAALSVDRLEPRTLLAFGPTGTEFRANSYTPNSQLDSSVAASGSGAFVVAWQSAVEDGSGFGIYAQRYAADGRAAGAEFRVNATTFRWQEQPAVAMDADGDFVVAWMNHENDFESDVFARRYSATGAPLGGEIVVNTTRGGDQARPAVAMAPSGGFVVVWDAVAQDGDGSGRRFSAAGDALGGEFPVNTTTAGGQISPAVASEGAGGFVVAWKGPGASGAGDVTTAWARRFDAAGAPLGNDFVVGSSPIATTEAPALAVAPDGAFLVAWGTYSNAAGAFSGDVRARRYGPDGAPRGGEFVANETIPGAQTEPAAAVGADGDVIVAWTSYAADTGERDIFARRFDADGQPLGGDFRVNTAVEGIQSTPSVACDAAGDCVVTWHSNTPNRTEFDVYAQRFRDARPPAVTGVFVGSSTWKPAFRSQLDAARLGSAALGFSVDAAHQLKPVAWAGIDEVSIAFDADVSLDGADLAVRGVRVIDYAVTSFGYEPATHTGTWRLGRPIRDDTVLIELDSDADGVSAGGILLDGEWTGNAGVADAFPSGDGAAGGDFRFRVNALPGDVNGDRVVNALDMLDIRRRTYSPTRDVNGDAALNAVDLGIVRGALPSRLPVPEPGGGLFAARSVSLLQIRRRWFTEA